MGAIQKVRQTADAIDEIANIIADPPPNSPVRQQISEAGRRMCDSWANVAPWAQEAIVNLTPGGQVGPTVLNTVCKPYFDSQGFDGPQAAPPPFTGGQCATTYTVLYQTRSRSSFNNGNCSAFSAWSNDISALIGPNPITGPVSGVQTIITDSIQTFTDKIVSYAVNHAGGQSFLSLGGASGRPFFSGCGVSWEFRDFRVFRVDGQPDNCGNIETEIEPGDNPPPDPGPFPTGQEPGIDPTGQPFFFIPDIEDPVFGPLPLEDDPIGAPEQAPPAGGDGLPGDPEAIGDEAGEVTGGEDGEDVDFGEPPEGRIWVGCIVETSTDSEIGNIPGTGPASTVWPSVRANVALKYSSRYGTSQRINSKFHEVFRPNTALVVNGCFLQVQVGSTSKVFPISALKCPENPCGEE